MSLIKIKFNNHIQTSATLCHKGKNLVIGDDLGFIKIIDCKKKLKYLKNLQIHR